MCGIVGYVGEKQAANFLIDGLTKLEYRGYDSAGIAVFDGEKINVAKSVGRLAALKEKIKNNTPEGVMGIGHTRWATHGRPSDVNSHPHTDCSGKFAIVHNGIIENFMSLKEELIAKGHKFVSETDTEVVAHLIEDVYEGDFVEAVNKVLNRIEGSYSLAFMCQDYPDTLICTKKDNPLVIGLGEGENFIASDIPAIIAYTRRTYIMNDGEIAVVKKDSIWVTDRKGNPITKKVFEVNWNAEAAEKGGYEHFMMKEIHEQPKVVADTLNSVLKDGEIDLSGVGLSAEEIKNISEIQIVACGSAYHVGMVGQYVIEDLARIPVRVELASEFRYRNPILDKNTLVIVVSQSGETADSLAALREAKLRGIKTLGIVNVVGSSIAREADNVFYTLAGPEISVATTKAYSTQLIAMYTLAVQFAKIRGQISDEQYMGYIKEMQTLPDKIRRILEDKERIQWFASKQMNAKDVFFVGRGIDYAICMEGSLKMKEISYIHSEAYAAGELKHGTIALITDHVPVIAIATQKHIFAKTISNIREVKARGAYVILLVTEDTAVDEGIADVIIRIPREDDKFTVFPIAVVLQLIAYYASVQKGLDVDQPRNLAKSVTVE